MATNKIAVIISHEYISRVKAKWFLLSTLLAPLALVLLVMIPLLAAVLAGEGNEGKTAVLDRTGPPQGVCQPSVRVLPAVVELRRPSPE